MLIFSSIMLGFATLLLVASGTCWLISFLSTSRRDWRRLSLKVFRWSMVCVLFYVNIAVYVHIISAMFGEPAAAPEVTAEEAS